MIGVVAATDEFRVAADELPLRTRSVDRAMGAVVVLTGSRGWAERAEIAARAGAAALIIDAPVSVDPAGLRSLESVATGIPVVVNRERLRSDLVADAVASQGGHPRLATCDIAARATELPDLLRDAVGWLRVLTGGALVLRDLDRTPHGVLALLVHAPSGLAATVTASALVGAGGSRLRAESVGETRVDVVLDASTSARSVTVTTAEGTRRMPRRHESPERVALRRAVDAVAEGRTVADLVELRMDVELSRELLPGDK